jgi:catalase
MEVDVPLNSKLGPHYEVVATIQPIIDTPTTVVGALKSVSDGVLLKTSSQTWDHAQLRTIPSTESTMTVITSRQTADGQQKANNQKTAARETKGSSPMPRKTKRLRFKNLKWTYQGEEQAELIAMAMLGQSNKAIQRELEFSDGEITYALSKAKELQALPQAIRASWRDGTNPVARQIRVEMMAVLRVDIQQRLPKLIYHPTQELAPAIKG